MQKSQPDPRGTLRIGAADHFCRSDFAPDRQNPHRHPDATLTTRGPGDFCQSGYHAGARHRVLVRRKP